MSNTPDAASNSPQTRFSMSASFSSVADEDDAPSALIGDSPTYLRVLGEARQVAGLSVGVLLLGETGTGKSTLARFIHDSSPRASAPYVELNCAALPPELIESELFGYEKGAFSGATQARVGVFEAAVGGTLFLDEIGEMSQALQAKLLKAVETKTITRLGSRTPVVCDVRFVYATNKSTSELREDLVYRIDEARIVVPPLRKRREDIPALLAYYFHLAQQKMARAEVFKLDPVALKVLCNYDWPGNIRQLGSVVLKIALLSAHNPLVLPADVGSVLRRRASDRPPERAELELEDALVHNNETLLRAPAYSAGEPLDIYFARVLVTMYDDLLEVGNNHATIARKLGIERSTLYSRLRVARAALAAARIGYSVPLPA